MQFNLSQWSLTHRSFTIYCMIALVLAGTLSYLRLGRNEDPAFTFRTMVVFAGWPGANLNETLKQVTERLERTLQANLASLVDRGRFLPKSVRLLRLIAVRVGYMRGRVAELIGLAEH